MVVFLYSIKILNVKITVIVLGALLFSHCVCALSHSAASDSATLWTAGCQAPLSTGILQARILEWVSMPSSKESSQPRDQTQVSHIAGRIFTIWATGKNSLRHIQLFWYSTDCSLPGSSVHEISQARILEWVAIPSPGDLSNPGIKCDLLHWQASSLPYEPPMKP